MDLRFTIYDLRLDRSMIPGWSLDRRAVTDVCGFLRVPPLVVCPDRFVRGCETPPQAASSSQQTARQGTQAVEQTPATVPSGFGPARINILPLSEITGAAGIGQDAKLSVYVALLDAFGSPVKAPCTLRFELYEYVRRSAQAKGQRLMIWPDIDLTRPADNHKSLAGFPAIVRVSTGPSSGARQDLRPGGDVPGFRRQTSLQRMCDPGRPVAGFEEGLACLWGGPGGGTKTCRSFVKCS